MGPVKVLQGIAARRRADQGPGQLGVAGLGILPGRFSRSRTHTLRRSVARHRAYARECTPPTATEASGWPTCGRAGRRRVSAGSIGRGRRSKNGDRLSTVVRRSEPAVWCYQHGCQAAVTDARLIPHIDSRNRAKAGGTGEAFEGLL
jgi:hypothetical protein